MGYDFMRDFLGEVKLFLSRKYYLYPMFCKPIIKYLLLTGTIGALLISSAFLFKAEKVIQIDVNHILNTRSVTTLTKGELITWTNGIDKQNGYLTMAAAKFKGDTDPHALPDDPIVAANEHHPAIVLHYANEEGVKYQARYLADTGSFIIKVPANKYSGLYLSLTSAYGASQLQFELTYKDGTELRNFVLPDWAKDVPDNDPDFSYVVHNMGKWSNKNTLTEKDHHNIHALNVHPDANRVLTAVKLKNLSKTYILFWAATGVVK
jgi:hypothetical protein